MGKTFYVSVSYYKQHFFFHVFYGIFFRADKANHRLIDNLGSILIFTGNTFFPARSVPENLAGIVS